MASHDKVTHGAASKKLEHMGRQPAKLELALYMRFGKTKAMVLALLDRPDSVRNAGFKHQSQVSAKRYSLLHSCITCSMPASCV